MSGRELDPDGTDSYHPEHPWEQPGHPLYLPPQQRTSLNWPPEPTYPAGPHDGSGVTRTGRLSHCFASELNAAGASSQRRRQG